MMTAAYSDEVDIAAIDECADSSNITIDYWCR
jgi:hypothetical protein